MCERSRAAPRTATLPIISGRGSFKAASQSRKAAVVELFHGRAMEARCGVCIERNRGIDAKQQIPTPSRESANATSAPTSLMPPQGPAARQRDLLCADGSLAAFLSQLD